MTTLEMIMKQLEKLGDNATYYTRDSRLYITIEDFGGFDEDWCEVDADIDEDAIACFIEWLDAECDTHECDYCHYYQIGEVEIQLGYASMDI